MAINQEKKSNRLLGGRRFTSADLNTSQEAFTEVLDLRASEIFTQGHLVPSSDLPFSGSTQSGNFFKVRGENIMRYYFRWRLTKSNVDEDVWFFINPTGWLAFFKSILKIKITILKISLKGKTKIISF